MLAILGRQGGKGDSWPFWLKLAVTFPHPPTAEKRQATSADPPLLSTGARFAYACVLVNLGVVIGDSQVLRGLG